MPAEEVHHVEAENTREATAKIPDCNRYTDSIIHDWTEILDAEG